MKSLGPGSPYHVWHTAPGTLTDADDCMKREQEDRKPEGKTTDISLWLLEVLRNLGLFTVEKYQ